MNSILTLVFLVITLSMHVFSEGQPVLMWSNTNTFAHQNNRKVEISSAKGLNDLIWDPMSKYFDNTNLKPEVVLIFAENILTSQESPLEQGFEFKSDGGSFPNLKAVIADSQSSIVLPFIKKWSIFIDRSHCSTRKFSFWKYIYRRRSRHHKTNFNCRKRSYIIQITIIN